ncbi:CPCC family cysteine-rich protein [Solibacillus cecembensis]
MNKKSESLYEIYLSFCGYRAFDDEPPGTYDICKICFWEDDGV